MKKLKTMDEFKDYWDSIQYNILDHADKVSKVVKYILPMVISKIDKSSNIYVRERKGNTGNVIWVSINAKRYCFSYDHLNEKITLKGESIRGPIIYSFSNSDSFDNVETIFGSL